MTLEESMAEANRILREAGWHPHPDWGGAFAKGNLVGGIQPDKLGCHFKDWTMIPPGHPLYGPDTPDEPHEAAAWLDAHARKLAPTPEPEDAPAHETHGETGADSAQSHYDLGREIAADDGVASEQLAALFEAGDEGCDDRLDSGGISAGADAGGDSGEGEGDQAGDGSEFTALPEADAIDADFTDADFGELDPAADYGLLEGGDADLGAEIADAEDEASPQGQDRFIGLDDLDRRRSLRIGDVVRISREKQATIWAASGTTETEYSELLGQVMHDTVNGLYRGPTALFERFNELQGYANAASRVRDSERAKVDFLTDEKTTRAEIEAFDPDAGWPT